MNDVHWLHLSCECEDIVRQILASGTAHEEVKWQEIGSLLGLELVDAGKPPVGTVQLAAVVNGSCGQWQSPRHLSPQIPVEQAKSSNGVLQMLNPGLPAYRVATSCHPAPALVQPKTFCVQENQCRCFGSCLTRRVSISELAAPFSKANKGTEQHSNEGWLCPRRMEDGRCLLHPFRWCQY